MSWGGGCSFQESSLIRIYPAGRSLFSPSSFFFFSTQECSLYGLELQQPSCNHEVTFRMKSLLNWTWILLTWCTAKPTNQHWVMVEESIALICKAPNKENSQLMLKRPELLWWLSGKGFEDSTRRGCRMPDQHEPSSNWLVGEVTGWNFRALNNQPSVPTSLESTYLWSACSHHLPLIISSPSSSSPPSCSC